MKTKLNRLLSLMLAVLMVVTMFITSVIATDEGVAPAMQDEIPAMQDEIPAVQEEEPAQTEESVEEPVVESVEEPAPEVDETPAGEISDGMEADTVASEKSGEETYVAKIGDAGYASLAEAIANAKNDDIIVLLKDCDEKVTVVQAPDVKITIDGNGKTYTGTITVDGRSKTYTTAGLTIQNLNFVTDQEVVFINLGVSGDNNTRYICNLTVSGCTFTGTGNKAVGIKSYTGGDKNLTITNCSATGIHSLAQLKNVAGVEVSECNVSGKNGISLGASSDVEISKCEMALTGYGVRADAIEDGAGATITDCKVEANIPVVIRNATEDYALTVNGTNEMIANNEDKLWCAIGIEEYGDYETLTPATGNIQVTVNDPGLNSTGVYSPVSGLAGTGTEEDPYLIGNYNELVWFRNNVNTYTSDGSNQYKGKYVKLTADIDLAGINWTPIGTNSVGDHMAFLGTFDGDGHTISNLYVNADGDHLGFFARVGSYAEGITPTVKNLKFHNVDVSSNGTDHWTAGHGDYVGGVIANAGGNSVVSNVTVTGDVYIVGCGYVGGIVGHGYPDMDNCHVTAEDGSYLHCYYWCGGGIIGYAGEDGTVIIDCSVSGLDIWTAYGAGGSIAGLLQDGNKVDKVSASNVDITTDSDFCMGYIAGNGECSTITNATVNNVTVSVDDEEITPADAVASVDGVIYFNLSEAIAAGGTVTLLRDVTLTSTLKILTGAKVVLDLNGHVLDGTGNVRIAIASYGDLTVKDSSAEQTGVIKAGIGTAGNAVNICGGTFTLDSGAIYSLNNAILIDEEAATVNIKGGSITAEPTTKNSAVMYVSSTSDTVINITGGEMVGYNGILLWNNTTVNMTGGSVDAKGSAGIQGNGTCDNTEINISGNAKISGYYTAIYHPQDGKLNISGDATLTGWTGVVVKGGDINISGGTISGTGEADTYRPVSSGFVDTGDGLYIEHYDNSTDSENYGTPSVTITGGTFTSANAKAVASYANPNNDVKALTGFIYGGTFSDAGVVSYLAEGCSITYSNGAYVVKVEPVAIVGGKTYTDLQDAIDNANGNIVYLLKNVTIGEPLTIGETVTLDGNGYTLTYTGSNRAIDVNNADSDADLTIMNLTVDCTASYCQRGINYNDSGKLTLTNVTVKGTNVTYALNLPSSSDNAVVEINDSDLTGCIALNLWGEKTTVTATDCVFTSVDKSTAENYDAIALNDDGAGSTAKGSTVTINGGKIIARDQDGDPSVAVSNATDSTVNISATTEVVGAVNQVVAIVYFEGTNDFYGCYTLQEALNCMTENNGSGIRLINDIELTESVSVKGKVVLDLNGKTISGTDNATGNYGFINIQPGADLTVNDSAGGGKITLSATNDRDFNSYSSVISNQRGKLTVNGGTIEHLGGTDMAYGIDNLTNGKGTYAETVINGGTVKSPYRAVRQFLNGTEAQNILTVNGGTIEGANKSIWMQDPSKNPNSGTLTVSENATLKGDVYLFVTLGSTEWPVDVAIAAAALDGDSEVVTGNIPEQYLVENQGGIYGKVDNPAYGKVAAVINTEGTTYYDTLNAAYNAAQAGDTIELLADAKLTGKLTIAKAITIDGNGYSIIADHEYFILETGSDCTIKNVVLDTNNKAKGVKIASGNVVFDTVTIPNSNMSDAITVYGTLTLKNYLKVGTTYSVIDARNGVYAEVGTVFDIANWRASASPAKCDLEGAVNPDGTAFFAAKSSTTYYTKANLYGAASLNNITLVANVELEKDLKVKGTLNLNGNDLTIADGKYVKVESDLTISGEGTVTGAFKLIKETSTLTAPEGLKVESGVAGYYPVYENGVYSLVKAELPEVVITDIKDTLKDSDPDLTFALNFAIKDIENITGEYLKALFENYGSYYVDYVLTISGLSEDSVTFNADGDADGYLAGQYDAWSPDWIPVPFEDVTVQNEESLYIMEYAAKLMNKTGLRFTLQEVAEIVVNFDCGVYFTPEFLAANPNMKVTLELKVFTEDDEGNKINDISVATNEFDVQDYVAVVTREGKQTTYHTDLQAAIDAAAAKEAYQVQLLRPVTIAADETVEIDLKGQTVTHIPTDKENACAIINNGTLTITDSVGDGKLTSVGSASNGQSWTVATILNYGTLTIEKGTVEMQNSPTSSATYAIHTDAGATLNVEGGKVLNHNGNAIRQANYRAGANTVNISGGYVEGVRAIHVQLPGGASAAAPEMNLNITGGELKSNDGKYNLAVYVYSYGQSSEKVRVAVSDDAVVNGDIAINGNATKSLETGAVSVTGGNLNGQYGVFSYADEDTNNGISITGGTFATDYAEMYATDDGYVFKQNPNGTYGVTALYTVTVADTENGTVVADKTEAIEGETVTLTITPAEDYVVDSVKVNGEAIAGNTFKMPAKDAVIEATFKKNVYGITVKAAENGTVTADKAKAAIGETVTLTVTPAEDYVVDTVKVNGEAITGNTFKMSAKDAVIEATFKKNVYGITVKAAENGTVTADKAKAAIGETVTLTVTPAEGYELDAIKVNGEIITGNTFVMTDAEVTVEVTFKEIVYPAVRIYGADRYKTAFEVADALKETLGVEKFENIVVACGTGFADALSGSYLANQKNAPILLVKTRNENIDAVKEYIRANLVAGGTVYLLGGEKAIPKTMETNLDGFNVKRLGGATRYETNLEILKEAGVSGQDILVCTGKEYADGLSISAVNKPVLLVKDDLNDAQKKFLSGLSGNKIYVIGGTNAVSAKTENALKAYGSVTRIGGATRYDTSVNVAKAFFPNASSAVLAYGKNFPDGLSGGTLAYSMNAPLILTANDKQPQAKGYATTAGIKSGVVLGGPTLISDSVVKGIFSMGDNDKIVVK